MNCLIYYKWIKWYQDWNGYFSNEKMDIKTVIQKDSKSSFKIFHSNIIFSNWEIFRNHKIPFDKNLELDIYLDQSNPSWMQDTWLKKYWRNQISIVKNISDFTSVSIID
jgi:hypothetical protein